MFETARLLWAVAVTASTTLVAMIKAAVDVALVGRVDAAQLAAFAFVFPILFLAISVGRGIYTGTAATFVVGGPLRNNRVITKTLAAALLLSTILGFGLGLMLLTGFQYYVKLIGAEQYSEHLRNYFIVWVWTIPMMFVSANTFAIARNMGYVTLAGTFTSIANIVGVACSWFLIPNRGNSLGLGLQGSAYSTFITSVISTGLCLLFILRRTALDTETVLRAQLSDTTNKIVRVAAPVLISNLLLFTFVFFTTRVIALYGQDALAAYGAIGRIEQILLAFQIAFTTVAIAEFSRYFAQRQWRDSLAYFRRIVRLMLAVGIVLSLACIALQTRVASSLTPTAGSINITAFYLRFLTITIVFQGIFLLAVTLLNLVGESLRALMWCCVNYCLVSPAFLALSAIGYDVKLCFIALAAANLTCGIVSWRRVYKLLDGQRCKSDLQAGQELVADA